MSLRSALVIFVGLLLLAGLGFGGFFWYRSRSAEDLAITLTVPEEALVGSPFDLAVEIRNDSNSVLQEMTLTLESPSGLAIVGSGGERTFASKTIGDVGVGGVHQESFQLLALSGANTIQEVKATVTYQPRGLSSRFEKVKTAEVVVGDEAVRFEITAPEKTFSGEEIELVIAYQNVSGIPLTNVELQLETPPAFSVTAATPRPDFEGTIWSLGDLTSSVKQEVRIKGIVAGAEGSFFGFRASLSAQIGGRNYIIAEKTQNVSITQSPLALTIVPNGNPDYVAHPGDALTYRLEYQNTTEVGLRDVIIRAKIIGILFDIRTVSSSGFLRSPENTVVWTAANTPELTVLSPGALGSVEFSLSLHPEYPITRLSDKNFVLKVEAEIESPTVPPFVGAKKTIGKAKIETKVGGAFRIDARGYFRDAASGILNRGPMPPVVGQPTQFTIHWLIWNYGTDITDVELGSHLSGNVRFTGVLKSNTGILPEWNDRTQEIVWKLPKIVATKGVSDGKPVEAVFQVELRPGENQIGGTPTLVQNLKARARDDFTGQDLTAEDGEIQTSVPDDGSVENGAVLPAN